LHWCAPFSKKCGFIFCGTAFFRKEKGLKMFFRTTRIFKEAQYLLEKGDILIEQLPRGYGHLADQLRRASTSIILNFAEGNGKKGLKERQRFFRIAKGSLYEVAAVYDVALSFGFIETSFHKKVIDRCDYIAAMLSKWR
jgi:four helix bundle protein